MLKIILNTENLNSIMNKYRDDLVKICRDLKKVRVDSLILKIEEFKFEKDSDVFKLAKKDFFSINKEMKKLVKEHVNKYLEKDILKKVDCLFLDDVDLDIRKKIISEVTKFVNGSYQRQLLESIDFKVLVKDTILINGTKEQNERYLFTLNNSRIFSDL